MPSRHFKIGHNKRPTHAQIAATPLDQLPPTCRQEADRLFQEGGPAITQRLASQPAKLALRCQGVQVQDLVAAADLLHLEWARAATPGPGQRKKKLSSWEHAKQLLAQVLWEEQLCLGRPPGQEEAAETESNCSSDCFGGRRSPRPPPTPWPLSRPQSAREHREMMHSELLDVNRRHWDERVRNVESARQCRDRQLRSGQQQRHERHCQEEEQIGAFLADQSRHMDAYGREISTNRKHHLEAQASRFVSDAVGFERSKTAETAARAGAAWDKRVGCIQEQKDHCAGLVEITAGRQRSAKGRRAQCLHVKSVGPPQLHTSRELASWQAKRLASLRQQERGILKECLDEPTAFTHRVRYD